MLPQAFELLAAQAEKLKKYRRCHPASAGRALWVGFRVEIEQVSLKTSPVKTQCCVVAVPAAHRFVGLVVGVDGALCASGYLGGAAPRDAPFFVILT